ncbi:MAG: alpha-E domain-containing protein, partial [Acidimicrobiia bacterium]|nr:alpha-E domain-containing protein [Acidimicrobiia bacterium]
ELEFRSTTDLLDDLPGHLFRLQKLCFEVGAAVGGRYFRAARPMEWIA